jgi:hypothetical protein
VQVLEGHHEACAVEVHVRLHHGPHLRQEVEELSAEHCGHRQLQGVGVLLVCDQLHEEVAVRRATELTREQQQHLALALEVAQLASATRRVHAQLGEVLPLDRVPAVSPYAVPREEDLACRRVGVG